MFYVIGNGEDCGRVLLFGLVLVCFCKVEIRVRFFDFFERGWKFGFLSRVYEFSVKYLRVKRNTFIVFFLVSELFICDLWRVG